MPIANSDIYRPCVALTRARGRGLEIIEKEVHLWKSGFKFAFGRNKKGKVFGIPSQLKNLVNLMMCMHKTKRF
jgi:hypothetical protein